MDDHQLTTGTPERARDDRLVDVLWRGRYLVLLGAVAGVAAAIALTAVQTRVYEARATFQVTSATSPGAAADPFAAQQANQGLAPTYAELLSDRSVLQEIARRVGGDVTPGDLDGRLSAHALENTNLIRLSVEGGSPEEARSLADDVAGAFVAIVQSNARVRSERLQSQLRARISALGGEIAQVARQPDGPAKTEQLASLRSARASLNAQLAAAVASGIEQGGTIALAAAPTASAAAVRPQPLLNAIGGLLLGLIVGCGLAVLRARLDRKIGSAQEVEALLDAPVLGSIPTTRRSLQDPVVSEAFNVLRTNLSFLALENGVRVVMFTSFRPREGKTATVEGVGRALARAGHSVLLVDGDARTRMLSTRLGHAHSPGMTTLLVSGASDEQVIVGIAPNLALLPAGTLPINPASLLSGGAGRDVIKRLRERFSVILIDSPPVAQLADPVILASLADAVVLLARVGVTDRADVSAAATRLRHASTPVIGAVVLEPVQYDDRFYPALPDTDLESERRRTGQANGGAPEPARRSAKGARSRRGGRSR